MPPSRVTVHVHVRTAAGLVRAELDRQTAVLQIGLGIPYQGQRSCRPAGFGRVHGQTGVTRSSLAVGPGNVEIARRQAPHGGGVPGMKIDDSTPDVSRDVPNVNEEGVVAAATIEKVRTGTPI